MLNPIEAKIKDRISSFVQELDLLVRKSTLEALHGVLSNGAVPARRGRPVGGGRGTANVAEAAAKFVAHVQANDGQGISAIADATGLHLKVAKKAALQLIADGTLKKSGQKRGTVYHVGSGKAAPAAAKAKRGKRSKKSGRKAQAA